MKKPTKRRVDPLELKKRCREMLAFLAYHKPKSMTISDMAEHFTEWGDRWIYRCLRHLIADGYASSYGTWYTSTPSGDKLVAEGVTR